MAARRGAVGELACIWKEFTGDRPRRRVYKQDHPEKPGQPYGPFCCQSLRSRSLPGISLGIRPETCCYGWQYSCRLVQPRSPFGYLLGPAGGDNIKSASIRLRGRSDNRCHFADMDRDADVGE